MMRIKEAIQRRRLIQQLNGEYAAIEDDANINAKTSALLGSGGVGARMAGEHNTLAYILRKKNFQQRDPDDSVLSDDPTACDELADRNRAFLRLHNFVNELNQHFSDLQRRALRVTWKRLSEPPKTSGRGTLRIMEKIFDQVLSQNPKAISIFYRSAFIKCIEERRTGCPSDTIATIRDHAYLLIDLIDGIMCVMFDMPFHKLVWDPATIGRAHAKYIPMGFEPNIWQKLGEYFAEIMFSQECVRAYPHAASAWSTLSVIVTDKMYSQMIRARNSDFWPHPTRLCSTTSFSNRKLTSLSKRISPNSLALLPCGSSGLAGMAGASLSAAPIPLNAVHKTASRAASRDSNAVHHHQHPYDSSSTSSPAAGRTFVHQRKAAQRIAQTPASSAASPLAGSVKTRARMLANQSKSGSSNDSTDSGGHNERLRRFRRPSPVRRRTPASIRMTGRCGHEPIPCDEINKVQIVNVNNYKSDVISLALAVNSNAFELVTGSDLQRR